MKRCVILTVVLAAIFPPTGNVSAAKPAQSIVETWDAQKPDSAFRRTDRASRPTNYRTEQVTRQRADRPGVAVATGLNTSPPGRKLKPDYLAGMPSVEDVLRSMGKRPPGIDIKAFSLLEDIVRTISTTDGAQRSTLDEYSFIKMYEKARSEAARRIDRQLVPMYSDVSNVSPSFRDEVLALASPTVKELYYAKSKANQAFNEKAQEAAQAAEEARKADAAKAKEAAREAANAAAANDAELAKSAQQDLLKAKHVDTKFFGISLGKPIELSECTATSADEVKTMCFRSAKGPLAFDRIDFPLKQEPSWAMFPFMRATVKDSILVALEMQSVSETDELFATLSKKYGKPTKVTSHAFRNGFGITSNAENWEWHLPGLHVAFELKASQDPRVGFVGDLTVELNAVYQARTSKDAAEDADALKM